MYTYGAQSVKCAVCDTVTQSPPEPQQPQQQPQQPPLVPQTAPLDAERAVYVENPDDGNEVCFFILATHTVQTYIPVLLS